MCRCAAKPVGFLAREAYSSACGKYATGADSTGVVCRAGKVVAVVVDGNGVGRKMRVGVPTVGEKRPQWRTVPSEPPEARIRCTGCHTKAGVNDASGLGHERVRQDTQQTSFLCSRRTTHSFIQVSNTPPSGCEMRLQGGSHLRPIRTLVS